EVGLGQLLRGHLQVMQTVANGFCLPVAGARGQTKFSAEPGECSASERGIFAGQAAVHVPVGLRLSEKGLLPRVHGCSRPNVRACSSNSHPFGKGSSWRLIASHSSGVTSAT